MTNVQKHSHRLDKVYKNLDAITRDLVVSVDGVSTKDLDTPSDKKAKESYGSLLKIIESVQSVREENWNLKKPWKHKELSKEKNTKKIEENNQYLSEFRGFERAHNIFEKLKLKSELDKFDKKKLWNSLNTLLNERKRLSEVIIFTRYHGLQNMVSKGEWKTYSSRIYHELFNKYKNTDHLFDNEEAALFFKKTKLEDYDGGGEYKRYVGRKFKRLLSSIYRKYSKGKLTKNEFLDKFNEHRKYFDDGHLVEAFKNLDSDASKKKVYNALLENEAEDFKLKKQNAEKFGLKKDSFYAGFFIDREFMEGHQYVANSPYFNEGKMPTDYSQLNNFSSETALLIEEST